MRVDFSRIVPRWTRGVCCASLLVAGLGLAGQIEPAMAQSKTKRADTQKVSGKVSAIEKKGKAAKITVEKEDGVKLEINVTPKMEFAINGKGDASFLLHPRNVASAEAFMSAQKQLIAREFTLYIGPKKPAVSVTPDPKAQDVYKIYGEITDADKESVTLDLGGDYGVQKVIFESGAAPFVNVVSSDAAHATEGAPVEIEGTEKSGKFLASKVTITLAEPMKADDIFGGDKSKAVPKTATKTAKGKAASKSKEDNPNGDNVGDASDPFGLKKKGSSKNDKADKTDKK